MARKPKQRSGSARQTAAGRKPVLLWLEPSEHARLRRAAAADKRPMTQFLIYHGLLATEKILENPS